MVALSKENNSRSTTTTTTTSTTTTTTSTTTEQTDKDKLPVVDKIDTKLTPVDNKSDKNTTSNITEKNVEAQPDVVTVLPVNANSTITPMNSFHTIEDEAFAENKKITSLNPVSNNAQHPLRNDHAPLGSSNSGTQQNHEEPFSPDGFTQFEKVLV